MKYSLLQLQLKINQLTFRERIGFLITVLLVVTALWYLLIYQPQINHIEGLKKAIDKEQEEIVAIKNKQQLILSLSTNKTISELLTRYRDLQEEMQALEAKTRQLQHHFISEKELARLLYSLVTNTKGVSIENIASSLEKPLPVSNLPITTSPGSPPSPPPSAAVANQEQTIYYTLTLRGDYFSIIAYLYQLEHLKWQLYWDSLKYQVETYPQALAIIRFYTLKPANLSALGPQQ